MGDVTHCDYNCSCVEGGLSRTSYCESELRAKEYVEPVALGRLLLCVTNMRHQYSRLIRAVTS